MAFDKVMWFQKAISAIYIYWFRGNCGAPSGSSSFGGKETLKRVDFHLFIVAFLASGLGAYTLFGLPYQWLAFAIVLAALAVAVVTRTLTLPPPGLIPYLVLFAWAGAVTLYHLCSGDFSWTIWRFSLLRLAKLAGFILTLWCAYHIVQRYSFEVLAKWIVAIGVVHGVIAIYFYFAQLNGWPELPRNRLGTFGTSQAVVFTYPFHRAMGTFQEPGLFADWMLLPLFVSFQQLRKVGRWWNLSSGIILGAVLLTGSLAAYIALAVAACFLAFVWLVNRNRKVSFPVLCNLAVGAGILLACIQGYDDTHGYHVENTSQMSSFELLQQAISDRLGGLSEEGVSGTNRGYVYDYAAGTEFSLTGQGLGISNFNLTRAIGSPMPASFLNLYLAILIGTGWIGLAILAAAMAVPVVRFITSPGALIENSGMLAMYGAYAVMFLAVSEEVTFTFATMTAIVAALPSYHATERSRRGRETGDNNTEPSGSLPA